MGPKASPGFILRMYGARRLTPSETPGLYSLTMSLRDGRAPGPCRNSITSRAG
jgi:hypothetical protein